MDRAIDEATEAVPPEARPSRRRVLVTGTGVVLAVTTLAACGEDDTGNGADETPEADEPSPSTSGGSGGSGDGGSLAALADVPVGGAVSATGSDGKPVIVAQPTEGTVVAFSAICTHQGCTVAPTDTALECPCHGSTYDLATGDNTGGPAPSPLEEIPVKVQGDQVVEA